MKIGMPALIEYTELNDLVKLCLNLNLNFIELNMNMPYNFIERLDPKELRKITKDTNIEFTMHMPDEADLGSFFSSVRDGYIKLFEDTLDFSYEAGIKLLNMHIIKGSKMTLPDRKVYLYEQYKDEYVKNFENSIKSLSIKAKDKNIILSIENSSNFGIGYIQDALDNAIKYENINLTWDTGHDAVSEFTDRKYLLKNKDKIVHMHFHDAKGKNDHQVPFKGDLNIYELIEYAKKFEVSFLVEVKTAEALKKSINILRTII